MIELKKLVLHPTTRLTTESLLKNPSHAILIHGNHGSGTLTLAKAMANIIAQDESSIRLVLPDDKGTITIEAVRELYKQTRGRYDNRAVFIIDSIETMGIEAQNAFLKLLEEPNPSILFILATHDISKLLPTVLSRVQSIDIHPISQDESKALLAQRGMDESSLLPQMLFIGSGLPAELTNLATDEVYRGNAIGNARQAKQLLLGSRYERLIAVAQLSSKQRNEIRDILRLTIRILRAQLQKSQSDNILQSLRDLLDAEEKLNHNGHIRTVLLDTIK